MALHLGLETGQGRGEIGLQRAEQIGVVGRLALHDLVRELQLAIGQQHRQLGPGQALALGLQLGDGDGAGEGLHLAVEPSGGHQIGHEARLGVEVPDRGHLLQAERECLIVVVDQDVGRDLVGH